jgi:hypothetical protein
MPTHVARRKLVDLASTVRLWRHPRLAARREVVHGQAGLWGRGKGCDWSLVRATRAPLFTKPTHVARRRAILLVQSSNEAAGPDSAC